MIYAHTDCRLHTPKSKRHCPIFPFYAALSQHTRVNENDKTIPARRTATHCAMPAFPLIQKLLPTRSRTTSPVDPIDPIWVNYSTNIPLSTLPSSKYSSSTFDDDWNYVSYYNWTGGNGALSPAVPNRGNGEPKLYTGLVGTHHRPSDDLSTFGQCRTCPARASEN